MAALVPSARPIQATGALPLENYDPGLAAARRLLSLAATAPHHRQVAEAYARLRVFDAAYDHFSAALRLDHKDAAAYDGRARVWRDWGLPARALSDAYHAIYLAPTSPVPQNTLGTLLLKMGLLEDARAAFARALAIDSRAAYALENLCRMSAHEIGPAVDRCAGRPR